MRSPRSFTQKQLPAHYLRFYLLLVLVLALCLSTKTEAATYIYTPFNVEGAPWTVPMSINNAGQITGVYGIHGTPGRQYSFIFDGSSFVRIGIRESVWVQAEAINNLGQVVGYYRDADNIIRGFIYDNGNIRTYTVPGASRTVLTGINDSGELAGSYSTTDADLVGFIDTNGQITTTGDSFSPGTDINNSAQLVGTYRPETSTNRGYLFANGELTTIPPPGDIESQAQGINNLGQIVGDYWPSGERLGFLYDGTTVTSFDAPDAQQTILFDINDRGVIVGSAYVTTDIPQGFVARPRAFHSAPLAIPGTIQAEDFDHGGEGIAYHDTSLENEGGATYRREAVDVEQTEDAGGGYDVGWVTPEEWLEYTVNVATAGVYTVEVRYAALGFGGTMHIEFDGQNRTGTIALPDSGGWQTWRSVTITGVSLEAGEQVMRLAFDTGSPDGWLANINYVRFTSPTAGGSSPFFGAPQQLPGTIQAEDFDNGGQGVAYDDTTTANEGGADYRSEAVDVEATWDVGGGYDVGWITPNEWLAYGVDIQAGTYTIEVRYAALGFGGVMHREFAGQNLTGDIELPDSGGWQTWRTASVNGVALPGGQQTMRVVFDIGSEEGWLANINWIRFIRTTSP